VDFNAEDVAYFNANIPAVLKQVAAAQSLARGQGGKMGGGQRVMEVVHCRIMSMTLDGRDRSALHKRMKIHVPPPPPVEAGEASEARGAGAWMDGVGPEDDELVFHKTGSNAFVTTNLHYVLGNLGVRRLAVAGVLTDECVAGTVKAAADLGYECDVLADACLAAARDRHDAALATVGRFAAVTTTAEWLTEQAERCAASRKAADGAGRRG
jgi:ureidoacrylate peracid hydrolase